MSIEFSLLENVEVIEEIPTTVTSTVTATVTESPSLSPVEVVNFPEPTFWNFDLPSFLSLVGAAVGAYYAFLAYQFARTSWERDGVVLHASLHVYRTRSQTGLEGSIEESYNLSLNLRNDGRTDAEIKHVRLWIESAAPNLGGFSILLPLKESLIAGEGARNFYYDNDQLRAMISKSPFAEADRVYADVMVKNGANTSTILRDTDLGYFNEFLRQQ